MAPNSPGWFFIRIDGGIVFDSAVESEQCCFHDICRFLWG
jgi:hypothetical protein